MSEILVFFLFWSLFDTDCDCEAVSDALTSLEDEIDALYWSD